MAIVTKRSNAGMDASTGMYALHVAGLLAGEEIPAVTPVRIGSDGRVYISDGADFVGFSPAHRLENEPCSIYGLNARFGYGTDMTPGALLYVGANGALDDAASGEDSPAPVARVVTPTDIQCIRAY